MNGTVTDVFQGTVCLRDIGGAACAAGFALDATTDTCTAGSCTTLPADCDSGDGTCFGAKTQQTLCLVSPPNHFCLPYGLAF